MDKGTGIFINGRSQVMEIFALLSESEKKRLLGQIKLKNPQLAEDIMQQSIRFETLLTLKDLQIQQIISSLKAPVLGVALKALDIDSQRRILSLCPRPYAEEAYRIMNLKLSNSTQSIQKACNQIKALVLNFLKKNATKEMERNLKKV